jgi:hypothetical protein
LVCYKIGRNRAATRIRCGRSPSRHQRWSFHA